MGRAGSLSRREETSFVADSQLSGDLPDFWSEALDLIGSAPIAFLATENEGQPHVRPATPAYIGADAYILTPADSHRVRHIRRNPRIELLHWTGDFRHLNLSGSARVFLDNDRIAEMSPHFPYDVEDFFGPDLLAPALIHLPAQRISITTLFDIIADKPPRVWRAASLSSTP